MYVARPYVIKFVSVLHKTNGFSSETKVSSINKTDCHDIIAVVKKLQNYVLNHKPKLKHLYTTLDHMYRTVNPIIKN